MSFSPQQVAETVSEVTAAEPTGRRGKKDKGLSTAGKSPADSLAQSVAYGTAAASKQGTQFPRPEELDIAHTPVNSLA